MINLFLTMIRISILGFLLVGLALLMDKLIWKKYSKCCRYLVWLAISIRLILPINMPILSNSIPWIQNTFSTSPISVSELTGSLDAVESYLNQGTIEENPSSSEAKGYNSITQSGDAKSSGVNDNSVNLATSTSVATPMKDNMTLEVNQTGNPVGIVSGAIYRMLNILSVGWIIGMLVFLLYHLLSYYIFQRRICRWQMPMMSNEVLELFDSLCQELNIRKSIQVSICNQVTSPMLIGFFRPQIILPENTFTMEQYAFILKHELIHYIHHDLLYKLLLLLANAIHWFNPMIYYMVDVANSDLELYCDEVLVSKSTVSYREHYSRTLLQLMTGNQKNSKILLATNFISKKKQIRNRFYQIMNGKPSKKGTMLTLAFISIILVLGNVVACSVPSKVIAKQQNQPTNEKVETVNNEEENTTMNSKSMVKTSSILVIGVDGLGEPEECHADSILVVQVNPNTNKINLISFLRDLYVEIPNHGKNKLSQVYSLGNAALMKETLETNFNLVIDHTLTVNMLGFEKMIDQIGGVELEVSEREADYLNHTNYISDPANRNIQEGKGILNGNQALGYVRIRQVPTSEGIQGDMGRTARLRSLLSSVLKECKQKELPQLVDIMLEILKYCTTDMDYDTVTAFLNAGITEDITTRTMTIPVEGSYESAVQENKSVLIPNLDKNREALKQITENQE